MTAQGAPLAGVTIVEIGGQLAGPLAGRLLTELGANVHHVGKPRTVGLRDGLDRALHGGKHLHHLDVRVDSERTRVLDLIAVADVVIDNNDTGALRSVGIDAEILCKANDRLIWVTLPGFATTDPEFGDVAGWEILLGASCGLFTDISLTRPTLGLPPVYTALPLASVYGGVHAALAAVAALVGRDRDGRGDHIEVPLASSLAAALGTAVLHLDRQPHRYGSPALPGPVAAVLPALRAAVSRLGPRFQDRISRTARTLVPPLMDAYPCADGRLLYLFAMDHDRIPADLLRALGLSEDAASAGLRQRDSYREATSDNLLDSANLSLTLRRRLRGLIADRLLAEPAAEWERRLSDNGIPCAVVRTSDEWRQHPDAQSSALTVDRGDGPEPGASIWWATMPGRSNTPPLPALAREGDLPLSGVRVLDLSSMVAGPVATRTLAELGADVIKVDAPHPHHGPRMLCWYGIEVNRAKRSVLLDLRHPSGMAALHTALTDFDVVVDNFAGNVHEGLGLMPTATPAAAKCPDMVSISAFAGSRGGPWQHRRGYDPVLQAATGIMARYGSPGRPELHAIASCVDALTGYLAALGAVTAVFSRNRGQVPRHWHTSLAAAAQLAQLPFLVGDERSEPSGQNAVGISALQRIYRCRDGSFALAAADGEREEVLAALDVKARADDLSCFGVVAAQIAKSVRRRRRAEVLAALRGRGIAAVPVRSLSEIRTHTITSNAGNSFGIMHCSQHPAGTRVTMAVPNYLRFARRGRLRIGEPAPKPGADTATVLATWVGGEDAAAMLRTGTAADALASEYLP